MRYLSLLAFALSFFAYAVPASSQDTRPPPQDNRPPQDTRPPQSDQAPPAGGGVGGNYFCQGTNPNGSTYTGSVTISSDGQQYRFHWRIARDTFNGVGQFQGNQLVVNWGHRYPVIYVVGANGVLHGTWDDGRATETLTPR